MSTYFSDASLHNKYNITSNVHNGLFEFSNKEPSLILLCAQHVWHLKMLPSEQWYGISYIGVLQHSSLLESR